MICSTAAEAGLIVQVFIRARDEMGQQRAVIAVYHESNIGLCIAAALMRKDRVLLSPWSSYNGGIDNF